MNAAEARVAAKEGAEEREAVREPARILDPRAVRVGLAPKSAHQEIESILIEPSAVPLAPAPRVSGTAILGGAGAATTAFGGTSDADGELVLVDDAPFQLRLDRLDAVHGLLVEGSGDGARRSHVILMPAEPTSGPAIAVARREVIVDGWRIEVEVESARRVELRERARRGRTETAHDGPTEVRAIIPGRVVALSIAPGDAVATGQQLLVIEAMKMQNELRAPRDGVIARIAVGAGQTIELGDLLLVLE